MANEFKLPSLGENVESGDVVSILVNVGETIAAEQPVLELETDKATVEVPSGVSGKIGEIHVSVGDRIGVGQLILTVETEGQVGEAVGPLPSDESEAEELDQAAGLQESPEKSISESSQEKGLRVVDSDARQDADSGSARQQVVPASPAVRRFAREIGVEISRIPGTAPQGRISLEDVKNFSKHSRAEKGSPEVVALADFSRHGEVERVPFNNIRRITARHLGNAWATVAHVTQHDRADVTGLEQLRKRHGTEVEAAGGKLTLTAIALKISAAALKLFPKFNASIDVVKEEFILKRYYNIGVAVDTDRGLLVPVIRDVDRKNILRLSVELKEIAERVRGRKVGPDELQGGTFTITNLGGIGGTGFTPIVNYPEVAILGISRTSVEPVFHDGSFQPRQMLPLSLSYDHRLIDGAEAARFLRWIAAAFEEPFLLMLEG